MMRANSLSDSAPERNCPLMKNAGVPCTPSRLASSSSFCTAALNLPLSTQFLKSEGSNPSWEAYVVNCSRLVAGGFLYNKSRYSQNLPCSSAQRPASCASQEAG